jgi:ribose transport system permease protein
LRDDAELDTKSHGGRSGDANLASPPGHTARDTDQSEERSRAPWTGSWGAADIMGRFGVIFVWLVVIVVFSLLRPETFFTFDTVTTLAGSQAVLLIIALGLLFPLAAGEFDLSVAGIAGLSLVLIGWLNVIHGWPIGAAIAVSLSAGLIVGAVNAFFVVVARVNSFITTLGTGTILTGVMQGINTKTTGGISPTLVDAAHTELLGLPLAFYYGLFLTIAIWYVMSHTPLCLA